MKTGLKEKESSSPLINWEATTPEGQQKDLPSLEEQGSIEALNSIMHEKCSFEETLKSKLATNLPQNHVVSAQN